MNRFLPLLLLSLTLLTAACQKEDTRPEPALEGRWNAESTTGFEYSASGQLLHQETVPDKSFYLVITKDSLLYRDIRTNTSWGSHHYTRQGNDIQFNRSQVTITELTDHTLTLRFKDRNRTPTTPYQEVEDHYTR